MATIPVTIPDNKVAIAVEAVTFYMRNESGDEELEVTNAMALAWLQDKMFGEAKRLVLNYLKIKHDLEFDSADPLGD